MKKAWWLQPSGAIKKADALKACAQLANAYEAMAWFGDRDRGDISKEELELWAYDAYRVVWRIGSPATDEQIEEARRDEEAFGVPA
jgi:hypothetical protein